LDTPVAGDYRMAEQSHRAAIPPPQVANLVLAEDLESLCRSSANFQIPQGFAADALNYCTGVYEDDSVNPNCPMRRKVLLVRVAPPQTSFLQDSLACAPNSISCVPPNDTGAADRFSNFLAGINRFEVVPSQNRLFNWGNQVQLNHHGSAIDLQSDRFIDYVVNVVPSIQVISSPSIRHGDIFETIYKATFHTQILDPRIRTVASSIVVPEISVTVEKSTLVDVAEGQVVYKGYDSNDIAQVSIVQDEIYRQAFIAIANSLMHQFPAVARVSALNPRLIMLDRGVQEGLSNSGETMLVFQKKKQLAVPVLFAVVKSSQSGATGGSQGTIACWDNSSVATQLRLEASSGEISGLDRKLYAVSIAPPSNHNY
jgi:hypothetical protein